MVDALNLPDVWSPFGAFSMAVIQGEGQVVHLKVQVSLDGEGRVVEPNRADPNRHIESPVHSAKSPSTSVGILPVAFIAR